MTIFSTLKPVLVCLAVFALSIWHVVHGHTLPLEKTGVAFLFGSVFVAIYVMGLIERSQALEARNATLLIQIHELEGALSDFYRKRDTH